MNPDQMTVVGTRMAARKCREAARNFMVPSSTNRDFSSETGSKGPQEGDRRFESHSKKPEVRP